MFHFPTRQIFLSKHGLRLGFHNIQNYTIVLASLTIIYAFVRSGEIWNRNKTFGITEVSVAYKIVHFL